ncbi:MAG: glycine cleavage system protein GcvH [Sporomusaceae bacterium]|nr:glycine cleavage system protein GcvH [Sporomusaceae bacterium]
MMNIPAELKYSKEHEWVKLEGNTAVIGITDFAQSQLGDVVFVDLPQAGVAVKAGEAAAVVESVKAVSDIYSPLSGRIVRVNQQLADAPEQVNQAPYDSGWIFALELDDAAEAAALLDAAAYSELVAREEH